MLPYRPSDPSRLALAWHRFSQARPSAFCILAAQNAPLNMLVSSRGIECEKWVRSDTFSRRNTSGTFNATFYFPVNQWQVGRADYHRLLKQVLVEGQLDDGDTFEAYFVSPRFYVSIKSSSQVPAQSNLAFFVHPPGCARLCSAAFIYSIPFENTLLMHSVGQEYINFKPQNYTNDSASFDPCAFAPQVAALQSYRTASHAASPACECQPRLM